MSMSFEYDDVDICFQVCDAYWHDVQNDVNDIWAFKAYWHSTFNSI